MPVAKSHNKQLRTAYFEALTGIIYDGAAIPVYSDQAPDNPPSIYIVYTNVTSVENSPKSAVTMDTSMIVGIYTSAPKYYNADAVDDVANEVLQRITAGIEVSTVQNVSTDIVRDSTENWRSKNNLVAIDRTITFRHKIFQRT